MDDDRHSLGGIEVSDDEVTALVRLWGDVDASLRDQASAAMVELLRRGGPYVVDVAELAVIDSSGIAVILQLHRMATDEGSTAVLRDPTGIVTDMLELIGLAGAIPCEIGPVGDGATDASSTLA